jgi:serine protease inhibitor
MLITFLYFKAKWQNPFDKMRTFEKSDFHTFDWKTQTCAMMSKVDRMEYVEDKTMQACFLPYQNEAGGSGPQWKAAIILPKGSGMDAMRGILTKFSKNPDILTKLLKGGSGGGLAAGPSSPSLTGHSQKISLSFPGSP